MRRTVPPASLEYAYRKMGWSTLARIQTNRRFRPPLGEVADEFREHKAAMQQRFSTSFGSFSVLAEWVCVNANCTLDKRYAHRMQSQFDVYRFNGVASTAAKATA